MPGNPAQLADVLEICSREGIAVVPFGGGTSVVGGVDAVAGPHERLISLDLRRIRSVEIDRVSLVATLGPGLRGPEAEDAVRAHGLTIGHFRSRSSTRPSAASRRRGPPARRRAATGASTSS